MPTISISPLTRIEGHLDIRADVSTAGVVNSAQSAGTMFRGFETILRGRDPRDAPHLTQRICGVCPISHGMASTTALEAAFGIRPADNGRILRNLVLASNFLQSHILHFYHLTLLDYVDAANTPLDKTPWRPAYTSADMLRGTEATPFINNYVAALEHRRLAHQMAAIFGGKMPCALTLVPGGCSEQVTDKKLRDFRDLLARLKSFVEGQLIPDADRLAAKFRSYFSIGRGAGNLLTYGVFDLNAQGSEKLFKPGRMVAGKPQPFDPAKIQEYVRYSYYEGSTAGAHPTQGDTRPVLNLGKADAYSWIKAPRYDAAVYEVGPLARMTVNGDYKNGVSVMDRIVARARECRKLIDAMTTWLGQLRPVRRPPRAEPRRSPPTASASPRRPAARWDIGFASPTRRSNVTRSSRRPAGTPHPKMAWAAAAPSSRPCSARVWPMRTNRSSCYGSCTRLIPASPARSTRSAPNHGRSSSHGNGS